MAEQTVQETRMHLPLPLRHRAKDGGVIVIPDWSDKELYNHLLEFIGDSPDYIYLRKEKYIVPWVNRGLRSRKPGNAGPTIDELVEAYGRRAIKKAYALAEKEDASVVFLNGIRRFSQLDISALFFARVREERPGGLY